MDDGEADLEGVEKAFESLTLNSQDFSQTSNAINILAKASRAHAATREHLADPKILQTLVETVELSLQHDRATTELALRCIGNACIDNNAASESITKLGFSWALQCLAISIEDDDDATSSTPSDRSLALLTGKVLYNICSDYELGQQKCFEAKIHYLLIQMCALNEVAVSNEKALFIELLFWICSQMQPDQEQPPAKVLLTLLSLPAVYHQELEHEDSALLIETCLLFLREPKVKKDVVTQKLVPYVWQMLALNEDRIAGLQDNSKDRKLLAPLSTALIWVLSELAASEEFPSAYNLDDDWLQDITRFTFVQVDMESSSVQSPRLIDAAYQILGNYLWARKVEPSDSHLNADVEALDQALMMIIRTSEDIELVHSAAGLLVQLTRLSSNVREHIVSTEEGQGIAERLCTHSMPQLKMDGISLLKALGKDSPQNQERLTDLARSTLGSLQPSDAEMTEPS